MVVVGGQEVEGHETAGDAGVVLEATRLAVKPQNHVNHCNQSIKCLGLQVLSTLDLCDLDLPLPVLGGQRVVKGELEGGGVGGATANIKVD